MKRLLGLALAVLIVAVPAAFGQSLPSPLRVEVSKAVHHDVSPPLRDIPPIAPPFAAAPHEKPRPIPLASADGLAPGQTDPALQSSANVLVGAALGAGFDGLGVGSAYTPDAAPPDTNGAVGATQYVQWVNEAFAVYKKDGTLLYGPALGNTLWSGFGGGCQANNDGDPIVQYDKLANRWVMTQFSVSTLPYTQCVAVSQTSDATGAWNRYAFSYGNSTFNDYPKVGVWPDGYYVTYNMFTSTFQGAKLCAFDRAKMLTGAAATQQCFQLTSSYGGVLPSDVDGTTAPPAGSPNFMVNFGTNKLNLWKFHVDWTNSANSTLTGPTAIPVAAFTAACNGGGTCIQQPGTSNKLDSLADRLMYRLAYRNFVDHEALVVNQSVKVSGNNRSQVVGVRWYELRSPNGTPTVFQQGTYSPDSTSRWMGSIAMDKVGDIAMGYSVSSTALRPSVRYTGRVPGDALGTMELEAAVFDGTGSQTGTLHRWGDYSAVSVDPVDDCTFWYTTEYLKNNGSFNWSTRIANFKFPGCQ